MGIIIFMNSAGYNDVLGSGSNNELIGYIKLAPKKSTN
jgi:hypothetical protein